MKKAMLITFSLTTRIVVNEDASDEDMIKAAYPGIQDKLNNRELGDNCIEIEPDTEVPYDSALDDISPAEAKYIRELREWQNRDHESPMAAAMTKPNKPGYYRANND